MRPFRSIICLLILLPISVGARVEDMREVVAGNTIFAIDLFQQLAADGGNVIVSPFSVSTALAIVYLGAGGETGAQMRTTLRFPSQDATIHSGFSTLMKRMRAKDAPYELHVANRLWGDIRLELVPRYQKRSTRFYESPLSKVDFAMRPEDARNEINLWVSAETNGKIEELLTEGTINSATRLVITNAITFKGAWETRFDKEKTKPAQFTTMKGEQLERDFMNVSAKFGYLDEDGVQVLRLPYVGGRLSMIIALPENPDDISELGASLTDAVNDWTERLPTTRRRVDVSIPLFALSGSIELSDVLSEMGMPRAFTDRAELRGIADEDLFIQNVVHEAVIEVNEEGTEAAAATGISIGLTSVQPKNPVFLANHPFIFFIHDSETGSILFMGRVTNPTPLKI